MDKFRVVAVPISRHAKLGSGCASCSVPTYAHLQVRFSNCSALSGLKWDARNLPDYVILEKGLEKDELICS